jgi:uncharacterized membrane protein
MSRPHRVALFLALLVLCTLPGSWAGASRVHAVLFYSPTCPHCHKVIEEDLPPLLDRYGEHLVIIGIDVRLPEGQSLFQKVMAHFGVPRDDWGVPALVIGDTLLKGAREIPESLPRRVEEGLAQGGIPWPELAGLASVMQRKERAIESEPTEGGHRPGLVPESTLVRRIAQDPLGNGLAILALAGMLLSLAAVAWRWRAGPEPTADWPRWSIPVLTGLGLGVAGYLSYVEVGQVAAVCGPVGDCNTVQQSPYARLFGLPVALLGLSGYAAIGAIWLARELGPSRMRHPAALAQWALAVAGTLFSVYFTLLEPFVIGATCLWCLGSAVIMTALLWAGNGPAMAAWRHFRN